MRKSLIKCEIIENNRTITKMLSIALLICSIGYLFPVYSSEKKSLNNISLEKQVELLIRTQLPNASIGIMMLDAKTGQPILEKNARAHFPPASVSKLFVSAAALIELTPQFRYETSLKYEPQSLQQGVLKSDLILSFSGDPSLSIIDFKRLISKIKEAGIKEIEGNIILETSAFISPLYVQGISLDSLPWYYAAPAKSIILNENQVPIKIESNEVIGEKANISLDETYVNYVPIISDVISVTEFTAENECQIQVKMDNNNHLKITGCWPMGKAAANLKLALKNPYTLAKAIILETLKNENISFKGNIQEEKHHSLKSLESLAVHSSQPLEQLLERVLQDSNNIYADSIAKTLGQKVFKQGNLQGGARAIKTLLKPSGIDFDGMRLMDGSGLSRYNAVSPLELAKLLFFMHQNKEYGSYFKNALPESGGEKGTLMNRFNPIIKGKIKAKTGSMIGISALAGYLTTLKGQELIFVLMIDHFIDDPKVVRQFEDSLCEMVIERILLGTKLSADRKTN